MTSNTLEVLSSFEIPTNVPIAYQQCTQMCSLGFELNDKSPGPDKEENFSSARRFSFPPRLTPFVV